MPEEVIDDTLAGDPFAAPKKLRDYFDMLQEFDQQQMPIYQVAR